MIKADHLEVGDTVVYLGTGHCLRRGDMYTVSANRHGRYLVHCDDGEHLVFGDGRTTTSVFEMTPKSAFKREDVGNMTPIEFVETARQRCGFLVGDELYRTAARFRRSLAALTDFDMRTTALGLIHDSLRLAYYMTWRTVPGEAQQGPRSWTASKRYLAVATICSLAEVDAESERRLHFATDFTEVSGLGPLFADLEKIFGPG